MRFRPIADIGTYSFPEYHRAMVSTDALFRIGDTAEEAGNYDLARQSFERAAALGDADCLSRLAYMFDMGLGVETDKRRALQLYKQAWRRGSPVSANNIAILYREQGKHRLMFQWFERAAYADDGDALLSLAKCYLEGIGVRRSVQSALRYLAAAVNSTGITAARREEAEALLRSMRPRTL